VALLDTIWPTTKRMPNAPPPMPMLERVPCFGPRNQLLSHSPDDELRADKLDICKYGPGGDWKIGMLVSMLTVLLNHSIPNAIRRLVRGRRHRADVDDRRGTIWSVWIR
jgi:hypothetical protein